MKTEDFLQGELERLFDLNGLLALSTDLLGLDPKEVGGSGARGTFARALVQRFAEQNALDALAEAAQLANPRAPADLREQLTTQRDPDLKPGTDVAGFRVLKRLGHGPLGTVYLCERRTRADARPERAALKLFHRACTQDRAAVWRFLATARSLRELHTRGLADVYDAGLLPDGRAWLLSEYMTGQSLAGRLGRTGAVHFNEIRSVARSLLRGLAQLHERRLLHGDLKLENIFVVRPPAAEGEGRPAPYGVFTDTPVSQLLTRPLEQRLPEVLRVVGPATYVAPEVAQGQAPDARSELYSAAAILYHALAGRPPFVGPTTVDVLHAQLHEQAEPPSAYAPRNWVPSELDRVVLRALAKSPDERFDSADAFADALDGVGKSLFPPAEEHGVDVGELYRHTALLASDPGNASIAAAIESLVAPSRAWTQAVEAFTAAADGAQDSHVRKQLLYRSARILEDEQKDAAQAEQVYQKILQLDPGDIQALAAIEELKRQRGDHEGLLELLLDRVESEPRSDGRAALLREIAGLYEDALQDRNHAFVAWSQALGESPDDEQALRAVERLARRPEQWTEAIETLTEALQQSEDASQQLRLYVRIGQWTMRHLRRLDIALPYLQHALRIDPAHEPALEALTELYRAAHSYGELAQLLLHRADAATNPTQARDLRSEAARVVAEQLGDVSRAEQLFREVLEEDPTHPHATEALERLYESSGQWQHLTELLEVKANEQRGEERVQTLCALAEIYEDRVDDLDEARAYYESALEADPRNLVALKGLERIAARRSDCPALRVNLERQLEVAATPGQRISLLTRLGALLEEELGEPAAAVDRYEQVIELSPGHDAANAALARLYRGMHRFDDLAQTLDRHAKSVEDPARKVELLMQAARVLMADVGSPDRAAFVCDRVLGLEPEHPEALELSARLKALAGDSVAAVDTIELLADAEQDPEKRAELWVRAGKLLEEQNDLDGAVDRYYMALDALAGYAPASQALRKVYERRGDAQGLAALMLREVEQCEDPAQRAALWVQLGQVRLKRLKDKALAQDAFEKARLLDEGNLEAALGLGQLALERRDWQKAADLLEPLRAHSAALSREAALQVCLGVGDAYRALGDNEAAQRGYLNAKAMAPNDRDVLERLGHLSYDMGAYDEAAALFGELLDKFKQNLSRAERGALALRLGKAEQRLGNLTDAVASLTSASEALPEATEPLDALREVQTALENWEALARVLRKRIEVTDDDATRFSLWVALGDVFAQHLEDRAKAQKAYVAALEIKGDDRNLLSKLMGMYSEEKDWRPLVDVLVKMTQLVDDHSLRAKYFNTAGHVCRTELKDEQRAIDLFDQALIADPRMEAAFDGLVACLTDRSDWEALAKAYQHHLERAAAHLPAPRAVAMYDQLAALLHERLGRVDEAIQAHEQAFRLAPEDRARVERLTELYAKQPSRYLDRAVDAHALLLKHNPYRTESYQALRKLYTHVQRPDEAWCACQALRSMNMAEPDEEAFYKRHRRQQPITARECFTEELWQRHILHPDQDRLLTAIFAAVQPAAVAEHCKPLEELGVDPSKPVDPERDQVLMGQMLHYAAGVTLVRCPAIYYRADDPGGISHLFSKPPSIALGNGALQGGPDQALAFLAGRQLSYYRPGHYMRALVPTGSGLRSWLLAAIRTANPRFPVPANLQRAVEQHHAALQRHLSLPQLASIESLVDHLLKEATALDMKRWSAGVDLTADRVGFILSDSLEAAIAVVRASPPDSSAAPAQDRLRELYQYCVSPAYLGLRRASGITISEG